MKLFYYITLPIFLLQFTANAQNSFKPGYIVNLKGDTTRGLVNYEEWSTNPDKLIFKKDAAADAVNFTKENTQAFGVEGYGNYHLFSVRLRQYTSAPGDQIDFADTSYVNKNIYLNEIALGKKVSLYKYDDGRKTQFLIAEGNSSPRELIGYEQINFKDYSKLEAVDTYKKQLLQLVKLHQPDNNSITRKIELAEYKLSGLEAIVVAINGSNNIKYVEKLRKKSRFFVGAGLNANAIKFTSEKNIYYPLGNVWSYLPQINAGVDLFSDKDAKLMFRGEMNLLATRHEFTYTNTLFSGTPGVTTYTYKNIYTRVIISLNPQILYNFYSKNKVKAFIAGGPKLDINLNPTNKFSYTSVGPGSIRTNGEMVPISPVYFNFTVKAGIKIERFQFYGAYTTPFKLQDRGEAGAVVNTSYNFGINYFLGK